MLAPSREFARALLGTVAAATKEQLEKLADAWGRARPWVSGACRRASSRGSRPSLSGGW